MKKVFKLLQNAIFTLLAGCILLWPAAPASADIVKPALIEISVFTDGHYEVEIRASIEALLTGINAQYKNTQDAPQAEEYDALRVMSSQQLGIAFEPFKQEFLREVALTIDGQPAQMQIDSVHIPEPGYTKVPRMSVITLHGAIDRSAETMSWYYPARFGDNAVRVRQVDEVNEKWHWSQWQWLRRDEISEPFDLSEVFTEHSVFQVIATYTQAGFEHILPMGLDHILFILGIYLLNTKMKPLLWQVTMFTLAHSITLSLSMLGIFTLPAYIVEPLIALSIAYVGFENIYHRELQKSRLFIVFAFGLLHGMGFASMLADFGMPKDAFATALISFNVGVELGQLFVIGAAFLAIGMWFRHREWYRYAIIIPGSAAIALTGLYWAYDRTDLAAFTQDNQAITQQAEQYNQHNAGL